MMKQKIIGIIAGMIFSGISYSNDRTMFIPRLISTDQVFELGLTNYQFHSNKNEQSHLISFKPFYQKSNSAHRLARFFLPNNKSCIALKEDGTGDVNSLWLNLISADNSFYSSFLTIRPQRSSAGIVLTGYFDLSSIIDHAWIAYNTAFVQARHNLHVRESNSNQGVLPGFKNACAALNNPDWSAGKLCCGQKTFAGLDDIQLKLGFDCIDVADMHISPYLVGTIPTGKRPNSEYLFEPLVGSKHGSVGFGLNADYTIYNNFTAMVDAKYNYFFASSERRSFDLINGDWSRYLLAVTQEDPLNSFPGINSFTKPVKVTPGNTMQLWTALHYEHKSWQLEVGYNMWLRGKERVCLKSCSITQECLCIPIGILDMIRICNPPATTASTAQINQSIVGSNLVVSDAQFTPTTIKDLRKSSAINPFALSNTIYGSCGYQLSSMPVLFAFNASYELTHSCGALNQYAMWGSVEVQF